jgi:hypothetical protein
MLFLAAAGSTFIVSDEKPRWAGYFFASSFSSWRAWAFSSLNWRRSSSARETAFWIRVSAASRPAEF